MTDRAIVYFINIHSNYNKELNAPKFEWPPLPSEEFGEDFVNLTRRKHQTISKWIKRNPERFIHAQNGFFTPEN